MKARDIFAKIVMYSASQVIKAKFFQIFNDRTHKKCIVLDALLIKIIGMTLFSGTSTDVMSDRQVLLVRENMLRPLCPVFIGNNMNSTMVLLSSAGNTHQYYLVSN